MNHLGLPRVAAASIAALLAGCGDNHTSFLEGLALDGRAPDVLAPGPGALPGTPGVELRATGSLRNIHLSWAGRSDATDYLVYRATGDAPFVRLTDSPIEATSYDDPIASPGGDGVEYRYIIAAARDVESERSNVATAMHGTRLAEAYLESFATVPERSPYVADASTTLAGDLWVSPDTKLYVRGGAVLDFEAGGVFLVAGLLRAIGSASAPAIFTAHQRAGGYLPDGEGFYFAFSGVSYNPDDRSGSVLDHVHVRNLAETAVFGGNRRTSLAVTGSGIALDNVKVVVNGNGSLLVREGGWVVLRHSHFDGLGLVVDTDVRATPFAVTDNAFRGGLSAIAFRYVASPPVRSGQIDSNDLDGSLQSAELIHVSGTANIPLGNNYWGQGLFSSKDVPFVYNDNDASTVTFDFDDPSPTLHLPPAGAGPDW